MQSTTLSAPMAHAFDAAQWLADFTAAGGAYILTDRLSLAILVEGRNEDEIAAAGHMIRTLLPDERAALTAHLSARRCCGRA